MTAAQLFVAGFWCVLIGALMFVILTAVAGFKGGDIKNNSRSELTLGLFVAFTVFVVCLGGLVMVIAFTYWFATNVMT